MKKGALAFLLSTLCFFAKSQLICFTNPSLEGTPLATAVPPNWTMCFGIGDIQPGQWGVTLPPSNGGSYESLLCWGENAGGYREGLTQMLPSALVSGQTYVFTVDLAMSLVFNTVPPNGCYSSMQVYGGNTPCAISQTLWSSGPFFNTNWQQFTVTFTPTGNWNYITFAPYFINQDRKSTRLNSSHGTLSRMPSSA